MALCAVGHHHAQRAPADDGGVQLADLIALEVGRNSSYAKIAAASSASMAAPRAGRGGSPPSGTSVRQFEFRRLAVSGRSAGRIGRRGKELAGRLQPGVDFQANHNIQFISLPLPPSAASGGDP